MLGEILAVDLTMPTNQRTAADPSIEKNTRNAFGISILSAQHKAIRRLKRSAPTPSIHGNKSWGSSYLLMDFLQHNPPPQGARIMELGCGFGLAGIHCAKAYNARVLAIDADPAVFPFLQLQAQHNGVDIETQQQYFETITLEQLAPIDVLIASDICFWDTLAETVAALVDRACEAGVSRIVIADPERPPFFEMANDAMQEHYGELFQWRVAQPQRASGCILLIENA